MFGLTPLGLFHTAVSLLAIGCAVLCLVRSTAITPATPAGTLYVLGTAAAALSALGIYRHGGFGPAHGLALLTLLALAVGLVAPSVAILGRWGRVVQTMALSLTLLFHAIPGVTETLTRFPLGAPVYPSADAPAFHIIYSLVFVLFMAGLALQLFILRTGKRI